MKIEVRVGNVLDVPADILISTANPGSRCGKDTQHITMIVASWLTPPWVEVGRA
jgi:hypothetical protein